MNTGSKNINLFLAFYKHKNLALAGIFVFMGFLFFAGANSALAVSTGAYNPTAADSINVGTAWSTPSNVYSSDNSYSSLTLAQDAYSDYLSPYTYNFSIPAGATINGIEVSVERLSTASGKIKDLYVGLLDAGSPVGDNKADTVNTWGNTETTITYGGPSDTWGNSWTYSTINDAGFGIYFQVTNIGKDQEVFVDNIQITVYYTSASNTCQSITSGNGNWNSSSSWTSCGGGTPGSADTAVINGTANITVTASTTVSALKFGTTAAAATAAVLKVDSGQTLTVTNDITMTSADGLTSTQATIQNGTGNGTVTASTVVIGVSVVPTGGSVSNKLISTINALTVSGGTTLNSYNNFSSRNNPTLEIQSGTFTTTSITTSHSNASNTATVTMATGSQAGTLKLTGGTPWTQGSGNNVTTLNGTSSIVDYNGTNQTILNTTYTGLKVSGNAGTTGQTATVAGNLNVTGTMTPTSGTITLNNGSSITNSGTLTFYNVTTASSATVTSSSSFSVGSGGTFTIGSSSTFTPGATDVITGTSATITGTGTAKVTRTSATADFNTQYAFTTKTLTNLTVDYAGTGQALSNLTYSTLKISGSITGSTATATATTFNVTGTFTPTAGTITMTGTSSITNSGTLTFYNLTSNSSAVVTANTSYTIGASGTLTNGSSATFTSNSGTVTMNNGSSIVNSGTQLTFNNLTIASSATVTANTSYTIATSLTVNSSGVLNPSSGTVTFNTGSSFTNSGTLSFQNLTIANSATVTGNTSYTVKGTLTNGTSSTFTSNSGTVTMNNGSSIVNSGTQLTFNNLTIAASATVTANTSYTVAGTLTVSSLATLAPTSGTITLSGTGTPLSVSGTFTASGTNTVQYTGTTATVTATTFNNLTLGGSGTYTMPASTITIKGNLTNSSGSTVTKGAGTIVFSGTSTQTITDNNASKQDLGAVQVSTTVDPWCNISSTACNSSWLARRKITMDNSTLSGSLTDFPVLVSVTSSQIDYAKTQNAGEDIRFVDSDGTTALSYQIEKWDESGTSLIWVKVPTVSNNSTDYFYMYYNNVSAVDNQAATSVWNSNYKGVWHLPNGTTLTVSDSTSNANTTTNTGATATTGKVDGGASYNGTSNRIVATASSSLDVSSGTGITVSGWFNPSDVGGFRPLIEWGNGSAFGVHMWNYPSSGKIFVNVVDSGSGNHTFQTTGTPLVTSSWQHVAFTYNKSSGAVALYHNGTSQSLDTSNIGAFTPKTNLDFNMGYRPNGGTYYSGSQDEIRVSDVVRSADWLKAEYNTSNLAMNTFGSEEVYGAIGVSQGSSIKLTSLTIDSTRTFSAGGTYTLTLTGNGASVLVANGTFAPATGTVEFASASTTGTTVPALTYYFLTINKASNTFTAGGNITVRTLNISAGTFVAPTNLTITGNLYVIGGSFTHNSGTIILDPASTTKLIEIDGSTTFNNLTGTVAGTIIHFFAASTYTFAGTLTLTGTDGEPIAISSEADSDRFNITFSSLPSLSYVSVKDGACVGGLTLSPNTKLYNRGNNDSCWGFVVLGSPQGGGGAGSSGSSSASADIFTASGSWTAPVGITSVDVEVWGGGGGSGYYTGGGGGGGAYSRKNSISVTPGNSYTVTVGAGGNEVAGGDSWFSATNVVLAKGGGLGIYGFGGGGPPCTGGAGGAAASGVGDIKYSGGNGGTGTCYTGLGGGGGGGAGSSGNGGNASGATYGAGGSGYGGGHGGTGLAHDVPPSVIAWGEAVGGGAGAWAYYDPNNHPRGARGEVRIYYVGAGSRGSGSGSSDGGAGSGGSSGGGGGAAP